MRTYQNRGRCTKRFYGVTFRPGAIKSVPGWITDDDFVLTDDGSTSTESESAFTSSSDGINPVRKGKKRTHRQIIEDADPHEVTIEEGQPDAIEQPSEDPAVEVGKPDGEAPKA